MQLPDGLVASFRARALTDEARFPAENIADLHSAGALLAPLPAGHGGQGWGTEPAGAAALLAALRTIGQAHLATGRLYEAHVNAVRLVSAYGTTAQIAGVAEDTRGGRLFGLWVTDGAAPLRLVDGILQGGKAVCSGAGHVTHAVLTAQPPDGEPMLVIARMDGRVRAAASAVRLQGMRAATTGAVDFSGLPADIVGQPGDYLRQPDFSAGAWRTSAVTLGGMDALATLMQAELAARGRDTGPHQLVRLGGATIARETAALWLAKAARLAEGVGGDPGEVAAYVNLARIAVESAALDLLRLVQRGLGLSAFIHGNPVEALLRDLATYLRQPAPDETLAEAAAWFASRALPA